MVPDDDVRERWYRLGSRPLRSLRAGVTDDGSSELAIVPGLGALGYLLPTVRACAAWTGVELLDVPGFGHRRTARCPAGLSDATSTVVEWLRLHRRSPVVLAGHSTGAQTALRAAALEPARVRAVILGGPTFPPDGRRWLPLAAAVVRTLPHESPGEIPATVPEYVRGRWRVVELLRTSMGDAPERLLPEVTRPVLVLRGHHDAISPASWAARLAHTARDGHLTTVPGAHNFCFTHADAAAAAIRTFVEGLPRGDPGAGSPRNGPRTPHGRSSDDRE